MGGSDGNGRASRLNRTATAPTPTASVVTAGSVKVGRLARWRSAIITSLMMVDRRWVTRGDVEPRAF
jgi:hypothetical protein